MSRLNPVVIIISAKPDIYTTQRIVAAANCQSLPVTILSPDISFEAASHVTHLSSRDPSSFYVISRVSWFYIKAGVEILKSFEAIGCKVLPSSTVLENFSDKLNSYRILERNSIPAVPTYSISELDRLQKEKLLVLKPRRGSGGEGVILVSHEEILHFIGINSNLSETHCIQPFYPPVRSDSEISDIRVLICKGRILGAIKRTVNPSMQRENAKFEFRSNVALGARVEKAYLSDAETKIAGMLAVQFPRELIGVDILRTKNSSSLVLEINLCPGFEAFEEIHGLVVAEDLITAFRDE